jgi:branched-chain amino acid transport system ATP-binding protein
LLEVRDLVVRYGRVVALQGFSLRVDPHETVAIVGPNGAGKTTLLNAIFGRTAAHSGQILFEGQSILGLAPERIVRKGLALVPEGRHIFQSLTVRENLLLGALVAGRSPEKATSVWMERFPILGQYRDVPAGRLSGGEQQQLAIARAMVARPRILLLDEPSLGLAPLIIAQVFDILQELRDQGIPILLVEQNTNRAIEFADRTYVLRSGRPVLEASREELRRDRSVMTSAYFGG